MHRSASDGASLPRAEFAIVLVFVFSRAAVMVASAMEIVASTQFTSHLALYALVSAATFAFSAAMMLVALARRQMPSSRWGVADVAVCAIGNVLFAILITEGEIPGAGLIGNVATTVGGWASRRRHLALVPALLASYLTVGTVHNPSGWTYLTSSTCIWMGFAATARVFCSTMRRMAADADYHRAQAAHEAEERALERARILVHDPAAILRMLADPATPQDTVNALRQQAATEARRLRTFMSDAATPLRFGDAHLTVASATSAAITGFEDLPLNVALDLAESALINTPTYLALQTAVATCLHNVREHAHAQQVFVHADLDHNSWEVTIRDDGQGYDPATVANGHGLRTLVQHNLQAHNVRTQIDSSPGQGCVITLTGILDLTASRLAQT